ncbi:hypothetical protein [Nostoc sp.]|uniref:hypothetical protein n=1 Tax=Nostoc sp. TaxID=1180 RepID=UPI002FFC1D36
MESGWIDKQPPTVSITISVGVSFLAKSGVNKQAPVLQEQDNLLLGYIPKFALAQFTVGNR